MSEHCTALLQLPTPTRQIQFNGSPVTSTISKACVRLLQESMRLFIVPVPCAGLRWDNSKTTNAAGVATSA